MKKLLILILLLIIPVVSATSIYDFIEDINSKYLMIIGDNAPGTDSFVAIDINRVLDTKLEAILVSEVTRENNLILIGNPCNNNLIKIKCEEWNYKQGEAIIKIEGSNLVVAGTTAKDTIAAGKIITNYKDYSILKQTDAVLVKGTSVEKLEDREIVDEPFKLSCGEFCKSINYLDGICRKLDFNKPLCEDKEVTKGVYYCTEGSVCCCTTEIKEEVKEKEIKEEVKEGPKEEVILEEKSFFKKIIDWIIGLFS